MISKRITIPVAAAVIVGAAGLYGARNLALASSDQSGHQTLAQDIASAFGLDPSKVQGVIAQYREQSYEQRLQAAINSGKLTSAQESAILTEHNTLAAEIKAAMGQTGTARRAALEQVRSDAQAWANANNVSVRWLLAPARPHLRGGRGQLPTASPTPSASPAA
jgi:hypothetical protein